MPQGQRVAQAWRTKLGDDGNQMQADGNSFPVFILGWTIAKSKSAIFRSIKAENRLKVSIDIII
jgi:hypothetical protein